MTSTILFVPSRPIKNGDYQSLFQAMAPLGQIVTVPIDYHTSPLEWIDRLMAVYRDHNPRETILAGHWFGAWIAFMCAARRNPQALISFSLPPLFSEDLEALPAGTLRPLNLQPDMLTVFKDISFSDVVQHVQCPTWLFVGSLESQASQKRTLQAKNNLVLATRYVTSGTHNDAAKPHTSYLAEVRRTCSNTQL